MTAMFRVILYTQWKWSRLIVVLGTLAAFAIPLLSLQGAARADRGALQAQDLLRSVQSWGSLYPLLATALVGAGSSKAAMVEVAGIEPASFGIDTGLLRAEPAVVFSAPAVTQASCRRAQSLLGFPDVPATGASGGAS